MAAIYSTLGLTRNPFAWVDDEDPGPFLDHLNLETPRPGSSRLLQLIGVKGAGKSTHLKHWQSQTGGPYFYVEPIGASNPPLGPIVYWDEADRIGDRQLRKLFSAASTMGATVVVGTHRDLSRPAAASGLDLQTIEFAELDIVTLGNWCEARIAKAAIGASAAGSVAPQRSETDPQLVVPDEVLNRVISQAQASLRDAGDLLHIWVARRARAAANQS